MLFFAAVLLVSACDTATAGALTKRLDNGVILSPPMGWSSYNHYSCFPNQSIIESNAKALINFGLADLGYHYVTTGCGWTIPHRTKQDTLTWNATLFPDGFPALGDYIHGLGLGFGVYSDSGVQMCMVGLPNQTGSWDHEQVDADTFASWGADLLKYDNCYSSKARGFPNVDYAPVVHQAPRFRTMRDALAATGRNILYQICEWRTIFRQVNQFVPSASFAGRSSDANPKDFCIYIVQFMCRKER